MAEFANCRSPAEAEFKFVFRRPLLLGVESPETDDTDVARLVVTVLSGVFGGVFLRLLRLGVLILTLCHCRLDRICSFFGANFSLKNDD